MGNNKLRMARSVLDFKSILAGFIIFGLIVALVMGGYFFGQIGKPTEPTPEEKATADVYKFSAGYVEFDVRSRYSGGQDSEGDWDIDVFEIDEDRSIPDLKSDKILDCEGVKEWTIKPGDVSVSLTSEDTKYESGNVCKPNLYKLMQQATKGDTENEIDDSDGVIAVCTDLDDVDGSGTNECKLKAGKLYLVTVQDSDENDFYMEAFLFRMPEVSVIKPEDLADSTANNFIVDIDMWADAKSKSELDVDGKCSDDQDHDDYNADDLGVLSDQLDTNTSDVNIECEFDIVLQSDGVALILDNPFDAGSQTYMGYIKVDPYTNNDTGTTAHDLGADGDDYVGTTCAQGKFINTLIVQGKEIVSDSTTDAYTDNAGEKLRANEVADGLFENIYDKNSAVTLSVEVNDIYEADVDATDNGNDCLLSDGEYIANIEIYEPSSSTDIFNSIEGNDPELIG